MKVEHENRLRAILPVRPAAAEMVRHQPGHSTGEIGVDDQGVGLVNARSGADADRLAAFEEDLLDFVAERDLARPISPAIRAIASRDGPAAADRDDSTPCSYSRKDRIEKRLGQLNGDIPRYFD